MISQFANELKCLYCGAPNPSSEWPAAGDLVPFYCQQEKGEHNLTITCPNCKRAWHVVWDADPGPIQQLSLPTDHPQPPHGRERSGSTSQHRGSAKPPVSDDDILDFIEAAEPVARSASQQVGYESIDLDDVSILDEVRDTIPEWIVHEYCVLPVALDGSNLKVAVSDPADVEILDTLRFMLNYEITPVVAAVGSIRAAIERHFGTRNLESVDSILREFADVDSGKPPSTSQRRVAESLFFIRTPDGRKVRRSQRELFAYLLSKEGKSSLELLNHLPSGRDHGTGTARTAAAPGVSRGKDTRQDQIQQSPQTPKAPTTTGSGVQRTPGASESSKKVSLHCPNCNKRLSATEKLFGKVVKCPACRRQIHIPAGGDPAAHVSASQSEAGESAAVSDPIRLRAIELGYEFIDLDDVTVPESVIEMIPESVAREHSLFPVAFDGDRIKIATSDSADLDVEQQLRFLLNCDITWMMASNDSVLAAINRHYGPPEPESVDSMLREFTDVEWPWDVDTNLVGQREGEFLNQPKISDQCIAALNKENEGIVVVRQSLVRQFMATESGLSPERAAATLAAQLGLLACCGGMLPDQLVAAAARMIDRAEVTRLESATEAADGLPSDWDVPVYQVIFPKENACEQQVKNATALVSGENPVESVIRLVIRAAVQDGASCVHFHCRDNAIDVAMRVGRELFEMIPAPRHLWAGMVLKLEEMIGIDREMEGWPLVCDCRHCETCYVLGVNASFEAGPPPEYRPDKIKLINGEQSWPPARPLPASASGAPPELVDARKRKTSRRWRCDMCKNVHEYDWSRPKGLRLPSISRGQFLLRIEELDTQVQVRVRLWFGDQRERMALRLRYAAVAMPRVAPQGNADVSKPIVCTCHQCQTCYVLGVNAVAMTIEEAMQAIEERQRQKGRHIGGVGRPPKDQPDAIMLEIPGESWPLDRPLPPAPDDVSFEILNAQKNQATRFWQCGKCDNVQQYDWTEADSIGRR